MTKRISSTQKLLDLGLTVQDLTGNEYILVDNINDAGNLVTIALDLNSFTQFLSPNLDFISLQDTFPSFVGRGEQALRVNALENGIESIDLDTLYASLGHSHDASEIVSGTFADSLVQESNVLQHESSINHNNLLNWQSDEHINHSLLEINALANGGLSGGGVLTTSRSLALDINNLLETLAPDPSSRLAIYDPTIPGHRYTTIDNLPISGGSNRVTSSEVVHNYDNVYYVNPVTGNNTTGEVNNPDSPYLTVTAALAAASAGDLVYMQRGVYPGEVDILKLNVDQYWEEGSEMTIESSAIFADRFSDRSCKIMGRGRFYHTAQNSDFGRDIIYLSSSTQMEFEAEEIESLQQWNNGGSLLNIRNTKIRTAVYSQANINLRMYNCEMPWFRANFRTANLDARFYDCTFTGALSFGLLTCVSIGGTSFNFHPNSFFWFERCKFILTNPGQQAIMVNFALENAGCELHVIDCFSDGQDVSHGFISTRGASGFTTGTYKFYFKGNIGKNIESNQHLDNTYMGWSAYNGYALSNEYSQEPFYRPADAPYSNTNLKRNRFTASDYADVFTTSNQTLSGDPGLIDGETLSNEDRILLAGQTNPEENGIWQINTGGAWFRPSDFRFSEDYYDGKLIFIKRGTSHVHTYKRTSISASIDYINLGVDPIGFVNTGI